MENPDLQPAPGGAPAAVLPAAAPVSADRRVDGGPSGLVRLVKDAHWAELTERPDGTRYLTRWTFRGYAREAVQRWVDRHWVGPPGGPWLASVDPPSTAND